MKKVMKKITSKTYSRTWERRLLHQIKASRSSDSGEAKKKYNGLMQTRM